MHTAKRIYAHDNVKKHVENGGRSMNRIKKELNKYFKLEKDYECLPYNGIQSVIVNSEKATITIVHTSICTEYKLERNGKPVELKYW